MVYPKVKPFVSLEMHDGFALADYLDILQTQHKVIVFSHVPHETYTKSWSTKLKNKKSGVHRGVPDYIIITPKRVIFLELKRTTGGTVSPDQKIWLEALHGKPVTAVLCKGYNHAKQTIDDIIANDV